MKNVFFSLLLISLVCLSCRGENNVSSRNLAGPNERMAVLQRYLKLKTPVIDAEFDIYDVNLNNRSIPGPTDRDYRAALLIEPENIRVWTQGMPITSFPIDYAWTADLVKNNPSFSVTSQPLMFREPNKDMIVFEKEGIIFLRITQH